MERPHPPVRARAGRPLRDAEERLAAEWGRRPTRTEVAEAVGVSPGAVDRADQAGRVAEIAV